MLSVAWRAHKSHDGPVMSQIDRSGLRRNSFLVTLARDCRVKGPGFRDSSRARHSRRAGMTNQETQTETLPMGSRRSG